MDIFITWSGPRSLAVAEALKEYLPLIVNDFSPWLSEADINKGANWGTELTAALSRARAGIVCLTPSNLTAPWLLFEAGAIAKSVAEKPLACTLLIGLKSSDLSGPLTLFQDTKLTRDDLLKLVKTLNNALGEKAVKEAQIEKAFDLVWQELSERLDRLPSDGSAERPRRAEYDMLEELVDLARSKSASDAALLAQAEGRVTELTVRLAGAERSLSLERERARLISDLERDLAARITAQGAEMFPVTGAAERAAGLSADTMEKARRAAEAMIGLRADEARRIEAVANAVRKVQAEAIDQVRASVDQSRKIDPKTE
jgi:hypothetical protein